MKTLIGNLIRGVGAQDAAEYGIGLAIIGTLAGLVALAIHSDVSSLWSNAQSVIQGAL